LGKQLNVMQTTHHQQPDHILSFKRVAHHTQHVGVTRNSNAKYTLQSHFDKVKEMMINNKKYILTNK